MSIERRGTKTRGRRWWGSFATGTHFSDHGDLGSTGIAPVKRKGRRVEQRRICRGVLFVEILVALVVGLWLKLGCPSGSTGRTFWKCRPNPSHSPAAQSRDEQLFMNSAESLSSLPMEPRLYGNSGSSDSTLTVIVYMVQQLSEIAQRHRNKQKIKPCIVSFYTPNAQLTRVRSWPPIRRLAVARGGTTVRSRAAI